MWRVYLDKGDYRQALVHCRRWAGQLRQCSWCLRCAWHAQIGALRSNFGRHCLFAGIAGLGMHLRRPLWAAQLMFIAAWPALTPRLPHCCSAAQRNSVYLAEAASLFEDGEYVQAAALYGKVGLGLGAGVTTAGTAARTYITPMPDMYPPPEAGAWSHHTTPCPSAPVNGPALLRCICTHVRRSRLPRLHLRRWRFA